MANMASPLEPDSYFRRPLTWILQGRGVTRLLRELSLQGGPLSASVLAEKTRLTRQAVHDALGSLRVTKIVQAEGSGRAILYQINRRHPLAQGITELFVEEYARTRAVLDQIRVVLDEARVSPTAAWIYGSVARGEDAPHSDVDLALLFADIDEVEDATEAVRMGLHCLAEEQMLSFSVMGLSYADVCRLGEAQDPFWRDLEQDSIAVKGPRPEKAYRTARQSGRKSKRGMVK